MPAVITPTFRRKNAKRIYDAVQSGTEDYYIGIGKNDPWKKNIDGAEEITLPTGSEYQIRETLMNLIALKNVNIKDSQGDTAGNDFNVSFVIPHYKWKTGEKYKAWDPNDTQCFYTNTITRENACFVVYSNCIFLCVKQGKDSTNIPVSSTTNPDPLSTVGMIPTSSSDGYFWVKVQNSNIQLSQNSSLNIVDHPLYTRSYIPVLEKSFGIADGSSQLIRFNIKNSGGNLSSPTQPSDNPHHVCKIYGDGTGATAKVYISSGGSVSNIELNAPGSGYTYGYIDFSTIPLKDNTAQFTNPKVDLIYSPKKAFGRDPINELPTWFVGFTSTLDGEELGEFPISTETDYRQICLVKDPQFNSDSQDPINTTTLLRINYLPSGGSDSFNEGDILEFYSDTNMNSPIGRAYVDYKGLQGSTKYILVHQNYEVGLGELNPSTGKPVKFRKISNNGRTADTNSSYDILTNGIIEPEYKRGTGEIVFLENRGPVIRDTAQIESIKIILQF